MNNLIQAGLNDLPLHGSFFSYPPSQVERHDGNVSLSRHLCQPWKDLRYKEITLFLHIGKGRRNEDTNYAVFQIVKCGYLIIHNNIIKMI